MKIGIFGSTQSAHYLAQHLDSHPNIHKVYHFHNATGRKFGQGLNKYRSVLLKDKLSMSLATRDCDLILSTGLTLQLNPEFQTWLENRYTGIKLIPNLFCSRYEDSKIDSKALFDQLGILTPQYRTVSYQILLDQFDHIPRPFVVKYDRDFRLGRQTLVVNDINYQEIKQELITHGDKKFISKEPNTEFIIEQYVQGKEHSLHVLARGRSWCYLGSARDYKKELDQDQGNNVTSMGCYSPAGQLTDSVAGYVDKLLGYFDDQGQAYHGILYLNILCDNQGQDWLLEINCRPGNPEFITVINNLDEDIVALLCQDQFDRKLAKLKQSVSVNIQLHDHVDIYNTASRPEITLPIPPRDILLHYADHQGLMPQCGITTESADLKQAHDRLYSWLADIECAAKYRTDIARWL